MAVSSPFPPAPPVMPTLMARSFTNGNFQLQLASSTNTGFGLLASTNLTTWTNIGWGFTGTNGVLLFQDTNTSQFHQRFYTVSIFIISYNLSLLIKYHLHPHNRELILHY